MPYGSLCEGLAIDEASVRDRIKTLKEQRLVRQISAIFNTGALGYRSSLVAAAVPENELEHAAAVINRYPGVSHNYHRPGEFSMWYTIAVPPGQDLEATVKGLASASGGWPTLILPALKKYKLAVVLDVLEEAEPEAAESSPQVPLMEWKSMFLHSEENVRIVRCIQEDLPLVERPFQVWAKSLDMTEQTLLTLMGQWIEEGVIRRFAAVLNHRQVGFSANGMLVWDCPVNRMDETGLILASHPEVSHCYHRPAHPDWPFNLYAMIHGRNMEDCRRIAERLGESIQLPEYRILFSAKEYKKIRLKLFWD